MNQSMIRRVRLDFIVWAMLPLVFLVGCGKRVEGLLALKKVSDAQAQMAKEVSEVNQRFDKLLSDIQKGRLSTEYSRQAIARRYGPPILSERYTLDHQDAERWLYRYGTEFFASERFYFYFDVSGRLKYWEHVPVKEVNDG